MIRGLSSCSGPYWVERESYQESILITVCFNLETFIHLPLIPVLDLLIQFMNIDVMSKNDFIHNANSNNWSIFHINLVFYFLLDQCGCPSFLSFL